VICGKQECHFSSFCTSSFSPNHASYFASSIASKIDFGLSSKFTPRFSSIIASLFDFKVNSMIVSFVASKIDSIFTSLFST
jgi:hypothetical protein